MSARTSTPATRWKPAPDRMNMTPQTPASESRISSAEFVTLIASLMSIVALSIDALLPALGIMRADLRLAEANQVQYVITAVFAGMAFGQLLFGPLSDAIGRKSPLYLGLFLFFAGSVVSQSSDTLAQMLAGRVVQGFGIAGPYVCAVSIVRDRYSGRRMAKLMSLIMMIFFLVPALAPSLGQLVLDLAGWRHIFSVYMAYAAILTVWLFFRLDETLPAERRTRLRVQDFAVGFRTVLGNANTRWCIACIGLFFGGFIGYLNSSQQIFQEQFATGKTFTLYFGLLALTLGGASLLNARWVERFGMRRICGWANLCMIAASLVFLAMHAVTAIELPMFLAYSAVLFFCFGFMFGNLNAMAMEPMGECAGIASAIIGMVSSVMSILIGTMIGQLYDGTAIPLTAGFLVLCLLSFCVMGLIDEPAATATQAA
jgi:MFS transporter, DHA1 family, multidrug resistance protein